MHCNFHPLSRLHNVFRLGDLVRRAVSADENLSDLYRCLVLDDAVLSNQSSSRMIGKGRGTIGAQARCAGARTRLLRAPHHFFASRLFSDWLLVNHHFRPGVANHNHTDTPFHARLCRSTCFAVFFNHPVFSFWAFRSPLPVGALVHGSTRPVHKVVVTGNRQYCYTLAHLPGQSCKLTGLVKTAHQLASYFTSSLRIDSSSFRRFRGGLGIRHLEFIKRIKHNLGK